MGKIVVFDSGFGSLSVIKAIQKRTKSHIIYFADQKNYPYGKKSKSELEKIIKHTVSYLKKKFKPDLIVVGSNTPSLLIGKLFSNDDTVIGVLPPLHTAQQITKTNSIAVLVTSSVANSPELDEYVRKNLTKKIKVAKIDSSELVDLVESGKFIHSKRFCTDKITSVLKQKFTSESVDVATLSSTHLPFLLPILQQVFPDVTFLDPADGVAKQITDHKLFLPSKRNTIKIFSSANPNKFQAHLKKIGIKKSVGEINF